MAPSLTSLSLTPFTVAGRVNSGAFQKAKTIAEKCDAAASATVTALAPADYDKLLLELASEYGGPAYLHEAGVAVYSDVAGWIGDDAAFVKWLETNNVGGVSKAVNSYNGKGVNWDELAVAEYQKLLCESGLTFAFLEFSFDGSVIGRLTFELFPDLAPKTVANFLALCEKGYPGSPIHRIKAGGWLQGGDVATGDGDGGASADGEVLPDESFHLNHSEVGLLGMANSGRPHTAASQFYCTFAPCASLDGKYSIFGKLADGTKLLRFLELVDTANDRPKGELIISACGLVQAGGTSEEDAAAARLQSLQRARMKRKELNEKKAAAARIAAAKRGQKARKERKEQEEAATKVQAISRGRKSRSKAKSAPAE